MAEKETKNKPKDLIEAVPEEIQKLGNDGSIAAEAQPEVSPEERDRANRVDAWAPKTQIGRDVKSGKETDIDNILNSRNKILEPEIVDSLLKLESDLILIGQAKGKFGGGKRRAWRQTQRKTMEGNVVSFSAMVVVGDKKGHVGVGLGKGKETKPAREKAQREARLGIQRIELGCGHFDCSCSEKHSIPFIVQGKCGSVRVKLMPAPQGTGLVVGDQLKKLLRLAGIKDIYGVTDGQTRTTFNAVKACFYALLKTTEVKR
ncbi:MAG TPA: 30S ribosomal protein S5 [Candidatus Nanoarchaeia archaeon]|nr:30S ribosomal protein S5 [Candidatus Nanoarchaeia archaeon]